MERPIGIAFQGGGARLIGLIAAAHALAELERTTNIQIRAISGSSAGSIAALLLAANADFDRIKDVIRQLAPTIKKSFPPVTNKKLYYRFLKFLLTGETIYSYEKLRNIVNEILSRSNIDPRKKISDLGVRKKLFLMYSDIRAYAAEPAHASELVGEAIARSCALPVAFTSYKTAGSSQRVDGGILENLPTDVLMKSQADPYPVFAIGFKPEPHGPANSPLHYLYTLASSGIQFRILAAKKAIGEDMVLDLDTSLRTLDFDKIVEVGIEKEYNEIKEQTRLFFQAYLSGDGIFKDPLSETRGVAPLHKLKSLEKSVYNYVFDSISRAECRNKFLKMRVNACSLRNPNNHDEIFVEQLIKFPPGDYIKGAILPMTMGAGYTASVECHAYLGGPEGKEIRLEQFLINDTTSEIAQMGGNANLVVLLFKGDLKPLIGASVYIVKKESRYGFMLDLKNKQRDFLSIRSFYWPADEVSITLNVPKQFPAIRCEWLREEGDGPPPEELTANQNLIPTGFTGYTRALRNVSLGTRLKGNFYRSNVAADGLTE